MWNTYSAGGPRVLDATESMDLSDRVRMWMLLNMIAQKTGNLSKM